MNKDAQQKLADGYKVVLAGEDTLGLAALELQTAGDELILVITEGAPTRLEVNNEANHVIQASAWTGGFDITMGSIAITIKARPGADDEESAGGSDEKGGAP